MHKHWIALREIGTGSTTDGYRLQLLGTFHNVRVYAAIAERGLHSAYVFEFSDRTDLGKVKSSEGRVLIIRVGRFPGLPSNRQAVALELHDLDFEDLFARFGDDVIDMVKKSWDEPSVAASIVSCIEKWRAFVERSRRPMTDEEVRGLIGELVVLNRCISHFGVATALQSWTGPARGLRDFALPTAEIEVKSYQPGGKASVVISPPEQLEYEGDLYLAAVPLSITSSSTGRTLHDIIRHVESKIDDGDEKCAIFTQALGKAGYVSSYAETLDTRFSIGSLTLYVVSDDFPRIKSEYVPLDVQYVQYVLALGGLRRFVCDSSKVLGNQDRSLEEEF